MHGFLSLETSILGAIKVTSGRLSTPSLSPCLGFIIIGDEVGQQSRTSAGRMASQGKLEEFDGTAWTSWAERLSFYCEANAVEEPSKKRALLLTLCGPKTYEVVRALVAPRTPANVSFDELMAQLQKQFDPRPSELFSRAKFKEETNNPGNPYPATRRL